LATMNSKTYDIVIVGGGIVGLATAYSLTQKDPSLHVALVEKEAGWAAHQTGHNSGVIHSGIYYPPGSLKANFAIAGSKSIVEFCKEHSLDFDICGKIIVATEESEIVQLDKLYNRGLEHGLEVKKLNPQEVKEHEPNVNAIAGIHVPNTGIVDYTQVCKTLATEVAAAGGELQLDTKVTSIKQQAGRTLVETDAQPLECKFLINCAGLHSDRVAKLDGSDPQAKIVPFRGEYYELVPEKRHLVNNLIYPVPNPDFPFLGVHFTRMIDGTVHAGPNAVLSLKREGYRKRDINLKDVADTLTYSGFWRLAKKNFGEGRKEMVRSFSKRAFVHSLQKLIPEITAADVVPTHAGVRAQALKPNGAMVDDFLIVEGKNSLHVCNAPSPAATSSLEIGKHIAAKVPELV
jgi:L-2-hydroxyglutarate oxidase